MTRRTALLWIGLPLLLAAILIVGRPVARVVWRAFNPTVAGLRVGPPRCTDTDIADQDPYVKDDCRRLTTFASVLLDRETHAPIASVQVYEKPRFGDYLNDHDAGEQVIVAFMLSDATTRAVTVSCGVGADKTLCVDYRPHKRGHSAYFVVP